MSEIGALYYIASDKRHSWLAEVDKLGFTVDDMSDKLSDLERRSIVFVGKLNNGTKHRLIHLLTWDTGYVLAVNFSGEGDAAYLDATLGSRFPKPARPTKNK
jgi:hypothetical protein